MVYYFTSNVVSPPAKLFVGKDKFENEDLIKYGFEEDVWYVPIQRISCQPLLILGSVKGARDLAANCITSHANIRLTTQFHVDNLSSAHVYYRLQEGQTWDAIPQEVLTDCAQLTKANSIEGNKKDDITIIYTPWSNLKKDGSMAVGQVGFKDQKKVKKVHVAERENPIVNRLNKTRIESFPDLKAEKESSEREARKKDQAAKRERQKEEARIAKERKEKAWQRDHAYDDLHSEEALAESSNQDRDSNFEDDFM